MLGKYLNDMLTKNADASVSVDHPEFQKAMDQMNTKRISQLLSTTLAKERDSRKADTRGVKNHRKQVFTKELFDSWISAIRTRIKALCPDGFYTKKFNY